MHLGPWEFAAYGGLWIGAFMLAIDVGLRLSPTTRSRFPKFDRFTETGLWGFTPLVLLTLSGIIFLSHAINGADNSASPIASPEVQNLEPVVAEKVIVAVTPHHLMDFYKNRTVIQGDKLASTYIGKWMQIAVSVEDVSEGAGYIGTVMVAAEIARPTPTDHDDVLLLYFDTPWKSRLEGMVKGDPISALCQIAAISASGVIFRHCDLTESLDVL